MKRLWQSRPGWIRILGVMDIFLVASIVLNGFNSITVVIAIGLTLLTIRDLVAPAPTAVADTTPLPNTANLRREHRRLYRSLRDLTGAVEADPAMVGPSPIVDAALSASARLYKNGARHPHSTDIKQEYVRLFRSLQNLVETIEANPGAVDSTSSVAVYTRMARHLITTVEKHYPTSALRT